MKRATVTIIANECLAPDCANPERTRGLCHTHYTQACQMVVAGRTSWKKLEATGRVMLPKKRGRKVGGIAAWLTGESR